MMKTLLTRLLQAYLILTFPLLLLVGSARLIMNPQVLNFEYQRAGFPEDYYGLTTQDRLAYGHYGIDYILNNEPLAYLADLRLKGELCYPPSPNDCPMFNELELQHMADVQAVASLLFRFAAIAFILAVATGITLWRSVSIAALRLALFQAALLTLSLIAVIILVALLAWDTFFASFHALFFEDGTWQFYYSDSLIRLYPEQFWMDAAFTIGCMVTLGALIVFISTWRMGKKETQSH